MIGDPDIISSLSDEELHALADVKLALSAQSRLDELLERNRDGTMTIAEQAELEELLAKVDQLTILKARANYTLCQKAEATGA